MVDFAEVKIWGEKVGFIRWDNNRQLATFQYHSSFLKKGWDLAPIKMPLALENKIFSFPELASNSKKIESTFQGLPGLVADTLPDRYGNQLIDVWLARNGRAAKSMNPVEKLCFIGSRGMGALEFEVPILSTGTKPFTIEVESLVGAAHKILNQRKNFNTNLKKEEEQGIVNVLKVGTSAGGARPKAVIAYNPKTGEVKSGQSNAPKDFEHWLLKLDGVSDAQFGNSQGYGRIEMAYHLMAKDCGIEMMECRLMEENDRAHFMTKRFDREGNDTKHHVQTFCALQHFDYNHTDSFSYEQLFQCMRGLRLTYPEAEQLFRRMVFNVLASNCDDHTKNFSFLLKQGYKWQLSPAYDVCYSYNPESNWVSQQTLSINGKRAAINTEDFLTLAKTNNIKKPQEIIQQIQAVVDDWEQYAKQTKVKQELREKIGVRLREVRTE